MTTTEGNLVWSDTNDANVAHADSNDAGRPPAPRDSVNHLSHGLRNSVHIFIWRCYLRPRESRSRSSATASPPESRSRATHCSTHLGSCPSQHSEQARFGEGHLSGTPSVICKRHLRHCLSHSNTNSCHLPLCCCIFKIHNSLQ